MVSMSNPSVVCEPFFVNKYNEIHFCLESLKNLHRKCGNRRIQHLLTNNLMFHKNESIAIIDSSFDNACQIAFKKVAKGSGKANL